jgi:hypothetical protein
MSNRLDDILDAVVPCECFAKEGHAYNCGKQGIAEAKAAILAWMEREVASELSRVRKEAVAIEYTNTIDAARIGSAFDLAAQRAEQRTKLRAEEGE